MTDTSTILKNSYNGNNSTTSFDYEFKILNDSELTVVKTDDNGLDTTLTLNTDYTISGVGDNAGGSITYPISGAPLASGEKITLYPSYSLTQTIDFTNQDKAYFELFEEGLDRANFKIKMLQEQINRSIKIGITSTADPEEYLSIATDSAATASAAATTATTAAAAASGAADNAESYAASINIPSDLSSQAGAFLKVKGDESGYEFTASAPALTGTANTFTANQTINGTLDAEQLYINGTDITPHFAQGQCRLEHSSATEIILERHNGNALMLWDGSSQWTPVNIPQSGVTYTLTAALSADTLYYIYAYLDGGVLTLTESTTAPAADNDTGYMVLPTSDKHLCVGMIHTNASKQLDSAFMVSSFFNRKPRTNRSEIASNCSTSSTSYVEVSTDLRCPFLIWEGDEGMAFFNGIQYANAGGIRNDYFVSLDSAASGDRIGSLYQDVRDSYTLPEPVTVIEKIEGESQGYHYATVAYACSNASYYVAFQGASALRTNLNITTLG